MTPRGLPVNSSRLPVVRQGPAQDQGITPAFRSRTNESGLDWQAGPVMPASWICGSSLTLMQRWDVEIGGGRHVVELDAPTRMGHPAHFRSDGVRHRIGGWYGRRRTTEFVVGGAPATMVRWVVLPPARRRLSLILGPGARGLASTLLSMVLGRGAAPGGGSLEVAGTVFASAWVIYELCVQGQPQGSWVAPFSDVAEWTFVPAGASVPDGESAWAPPPGLAPPPDDGR
jgi:hypothetical protein